LSTENDDEESLVMISSDKLAIEGGSPSFDPGEIKPWPPVDDADRQAVLAVFGRGKYTFDYESRSFQEEFAAWNGNQHAIFTNSGTAALHMCVAACGVGAGDHVLVPAYSWSSSATCVIHHNGIPVFVDIDWDTMNIDVDKIEAAITPRTKAIIVVHLHGLAVDMDKVMAVARKHNLKVIEDACQAHGALFQGHKTGTLGDCAAFSFNQNKCVCAGEAGMFVTNDDDLRNRAAQIWSFGETRAPNENRDYHAYALGWMYRSNELTAAFARSQFGKFEGYFKTCRENAMALDQELAEIKGLLRPVEPEGHTHNWYNYCPRVDMEAIGWTGDPTLMRDAIVKAIQAEGVPVIVWQRFILPAMTVFQAKNAYGGGCPWSIPGADEGVDYAPERFPVAQRHCARYFAMVMCLRAPNTSGTARKIGQSIRKVFDNIHTIDPEKVMAAK
jgi:perosamine synthetase